MRLEWRRSFPLRHSVFLPRRAAWLDEFRKGISAFPSGRHNDQVDALSQGLNEAFNPNRRGSSSDGMLENLLY